MTAPLAERLRARIAASGPLTIADYMEAALLDPTHGYYSSQKVFGEQGDFITAPEVSQIFGELIGLWLAQTWMQMGSPDRVVLIEIGPGRGTLMADILRTTTRIPGFHAALDIRMIEASPKLVAVQQNTLESLHLHISWQESLDDLPALPLLLVANEWFDALPIRQFVRMEDGWYERLITMDKVDGEKFRFTLSADIVIPRSSRDPDPAMQRGDKSAVFETCEPAIAAIKTIAAHITQYGGAGLIIDYGYTEHAFGDSLQAVKGHAYTDPLASPGTADITAHVNFAALREAAEAVGARVFGATTQKDFLKALGAELRAVQLANSNPMQAPSILSGLHRLISPDQMGALFKVMAVTSKDMTAMDGLG